MTAIVEHPTAGPRLGPEPVVSGEKTTTQIWLIKIFVIVPLLALVAAVPIAWGWGLGWVDIGLALAFYTLTCLGVTIGFHRHFTHGAFKANRGRIIRILEKLGWATHVRWPKPERLARRLKTAGAEEREPA